MNPAEVRWSAATTCRLKCNARGRSVSRAPDSCGSGKERGSPHELPVVAASKPFHDDPGTGEAISYPERRTAAQEGSVRFACLYEDFSSG